jgi:RNA polymerase sigma-70 factor (ECF subfamily)
MASKTSVATWFGTAIDEADFEAIYRKELPRVYSFFCYRVGDGVLAEDLTSITFEKAWRSRGSFRSEAAFSTWLFSIARRVAQDSFRDQRAHREVPLDSVTNLAAPTKTDDQVQRRTDFAHLSLLLDRLADRDRELVALRYGADLTNRAIAQLTGLTESNVAVILHRAIQALRYEWEDTQ